MKIAVVGTGYVGLVTGTCLADSGSDVICLDIDKKKVDSLKKGKIPIYEPGLEELVERNARVGRLQFTTDTTEAITAAEMVFLAVGTPPTASGSALPHRLIHIHDDAVGVDPFLARHAQA